MLFIINVLLFLFADINVNYAMFAVLTVLGIVGVLVFFLILPVEKPVRMSVSYVNTHAYF